MNQQQQDQEESGQDFMARSFTPVIMLDEADIPVETASGTLVKFNGHTILLTVHHAVSKHGRRAMDLYFDKSKGKQKVHLLGAPCAPLLIRGTALRKIQFKYFDFASFSVPPDIQPLRETISATGHVEDSAPRVMYDLDFSAPTVNEECIFAGFTKPTSYSLGSITGFELRLCIEKIQYKGLYPDKPWQYSFNLGKKHPGHSHYSGCSGSPILGQTGDLIGLVIGGKEENNLIFGVNLCFFEEFLKREYPRRNALALPREIRGQNTY